MAIQAIQNIWKSDSDSKIKVARLLNCDCNMNSPSQSTVSIPNTLKIRFTSSLHVLILPINTISKISDIMETFFRNSLPSQKKKKNQDVHATIQSSYTLYIAHQQCIWKHKESPELDNRLHRLHKAITILIYSGNLSGSLVSHFCS